MRIYSSFDSVDKDCYGGAVALGTFDGLHIGHRTIIDGAISSGTRPVGVLTFANHPLSVIAPDMEPLSRNETQTTDPAHHDHPCVDDAYLLRDRPL